MRELDPNCLFCRIVSGAVPSTRVYSDDDVLAFRDINPGAPTHALVSEYLLSTGEEPFEPKFGHVRQLNTFC